MKKKTILQALAALLISIQVFVSCNNASSSASESVSGDFKIAAVYIKPTADTLKEFAVMLCRVKDEIRYDSVTKKKGFTTDSLWYYPVYFYQTDSLKKIVTDSAGIPQVNKNPYWVYIHSDSVNWHIEGRNIDALLKNK